MTTGETGLPESDPKQRLGIILADYQACREDERVQLATVAAVIGVLVTVIGVMSGLVTQTCAFSGSKSCFAAPDYLLALSPMIPIALLAYAIYFLVLGTLRTYYMRGLENEIRSYLSTPIATLGDIMPASYMGIVQEVTSLKRGRMLYRLIANLILLIVILIFGGYAAYVAFHVGFVYQIGMTLVYGGIATMFVWQVAQGSVGGRSYFQRAAQDFLNSRPGTTLPAVYAGEASVVSRGWRPLVAYLIFPRPEDWIKWVIAPGVFLAVAWSFGDLGRWRVFLELWIILEYLIYEARYQWNDVRGIEEDSSHSERQARRRLPVGRASRIRRNILISLATATGRLIIALALGAALGLLKPVLILMALVLSIAIVYESLRSPHPSSMLVPGPTPTIISIWCTVGLGYGVRAGLGLMAGGLSVTNSLTWIGVSCFVIFGIMFVLFTWVLEAASCCYQKKSDKIWRAKPTTVLRPHLMALLRYVPSIDVKEQGYDDYNDEEDGSGKQIIKYDSTHPALDTRRQVWAPWNLALAISAILGGSLGVGLAHATPSYLPEIIAISVSLAAAGLLTYCTSQQTQLLVTGIAAVVLIGAISPFGHWPFNLLAAGPWLTIALTYVMFWGSSYRDLKEFGPKILEGISSLGTALKLVGSILLCIVVGKRAWRAAEFDDGQKAQEAEPVAAVPQQAVAAAGAPVESHSADSST